MASVIIQACGCKSKRAAPTFATHLPKELVPPARLSPDDPTTVEVFECRINGQEIAPAPAGPNVNSPVCNPG